jgi:hypothetical protein
MSKPNARVYVCEPVNALIATKSFKGQLNALQ